MREASPGATLRFTAAARCCTYHPTLVNYLVGRVLAAGGQGAPVMRGRLAEPDGLSALGVAPPSAYAARWAARGPEDFGNEEALTCPYWVPGALGCAIHRHRAAVCRTWFCKVEAGARGRAAWAAVQRCQQGLETLLAEAVAGPTPVGGGALAWEAYFLGCAVRADARAPEVLRGPRVEALWAEVERVVARRDAPLPEVVVAHLSSWEALGEVLWVASEGPLDRSEAPGWLFQFLALLDGERTWREACEASPADEALVRSLWARGLLAPVEDPAAPSEVVIFPA